MRARVVAAAWLALSLSAAGNACADNESRVYAVVSLVGDQISVVTHQEATGSSLDKNVHVSIPVTGGVFDKTALLAADEALKRHDPSARVTLLAASTADLFEHQDRFFEGNRVALPKEIDAAAKTAGATLLVLVTKHRAEASLQAQSEKLGSGKLEGLGFYVDREKVLRRSDSGERGKGFLAPFVYIKVSLVDLATSTVVREQVVTVAMALSAARAKESGDPWDVLGPADKIEILRKMLQKELPRVVSEIVARP
jgi:hypothetical protein